jgi:hypothetical protein
MNMSEFEYIELLALLSDGTAGHATHIFGALTAYLLLTHFVGRKLSSLQVCCITAMYSAFFVLPVGAALQSLANRIDVLRSYDASYPERIVGEAVKGEAVMVYALVLYLVGWLLSVMYMWSVRFSSKK